MCRVITPSALLTRSNRPSRLVPDRSDSAEKPRRSQNSTDTWVSRGANKLAAS